MQSRFDRYVIEARHEDGTLDLTHPQPESAFGYAAIHGITADDMAKVVFAHSLDCVLAGDCIETWPKFIDPRWVARLKTW